MLMLVVNSLHWLVKKRRKLCQSEKKKKNRTKNSKRGKIEKIKLIKHGERNGIDTILWQKKKRKVSIEQ